MKLAAILLMLVAVGEASRVLMVLSLGSRSHKNILTPLAESMGRRGHEVILASLHAAPPNASRSYTDLAATGAWESVKKVTGEFNVFKMHEANGGKDVNAQVMKKVLRHLPEYCDAFLRDPGLKKAWASRPDLVILPAFMNECGLAFVHKFKAPFMYVTTSGLTPWTADLVGTPENPAYVPNQYLNYGEHMTLWERTVNTLVRLVSPYLRNHLVLNKLEGVVQRVLGDPSVSLAELEKNVSMVLVNSHYSLGHPRPLMPNVVEVGAMHCRPARPLQDKALKEFLDSSPVPVVLFSLGSSIRSEQMPVKVRDSLVEAFKRLPYRFVWKWEGADIPNLPDNVLTRAWLPQQDVLGHKNVRAFFTHGGLLSLQEAVYHNVPVVGMPMISDQHLNVRQAVKLGLGRQLSVDDMTADSIYKVIREVLEEPSYHQAVEQRSRLLRDQETTPLDRAVYWSEHVLRYGGAQHLRSVAADMPLHQYFLLDVMAVLLVAAVTVVVLIWLAVRAAARGIMRGLRKMATKLLTVMRAKAKIL